MEPNFTDKRFSLSNIRKIIIPIVFFSSLLFYSCSSSSQNNLYKDSGLNEEQNNSNVKAFIFRTNEHGKEIAWKAVFNSDTLAQLFKNGEIVPTEEIDKYKDMVYNNIDDLNESYNEFGNADIHINMNNFNKGMKRFHHWMANLDSTDFDFHFDKKAFQKGMKHLDRELSHLKDFKFNFHFDSTQCFDTSQFNESMRKLRHNLEHMKFDHHDFECDMGDLRESMKDLKKELRKLHFNKSDFEIDMSHLKDEMAKLKDKMKNFNFEMKGFEKKMKKFGAFMKELKQEMVKDDLIKSEDEHISLKFNSNEMKVNGKKVPEKLFEKYKKMYRDYFGKDITDGFRLNLH